MKTKTPHIYHQLKAAGVPLDSHESDLYALVSEASRSIVNAWEFKANARTFRSDVDGKQWYDLPFANLPFWEKRK